ncbi:hypothetical protein NFI96_025992 [Prochilodus magdalenae]|nr:hypothetical protein NFI96_025992 [Prochilodus magdalenae]
MTSALWENQRKPRQQGSDRIKAYSNDQSSRFLGPIVNPNYYNMCPYTNLSAYVRNFLCVGCTIRLTAGVIDVDESVQHISIAASPRYSSQTGPDHVPLAYFGCALYSSRYLHSLVAPDLQDRRSGKCVELHGNETWQYSSKMGQWQGCWITTSPWTEAAPPMSSEASLLLVAGIVIGFVLIISCITIFIGKLSKGNHKRNPNLRSNSIVGDRYFVGSNGDLRPIHPDDSRTMSDWDSYMETVSQNSDTCLDSPPRYDESVEHNAPPMYDPTEAPPPYSLTDPCRWDGAPSPPFYEVQEALSSDASAYPFGQRGFRDRSIASISSSPLPLEEAPPYEAVVGGSHNSPGGR